MRRGQSKLAMFGWWSWLALLTLTCVTAEPECHWRDGVCPTLKCTELNGKSMQPLLASMVHGNSFAVGSYKPTKSCLKLEITDSKNVFAIMPSTLPITDPQHCLEIRISTTCVSSVDGASFDKFIHLERLYLDHNSLENFELNQTLEKLVELDLSYNQLTIFAAKEVAKLSSLKILSASHNTLRGLGGVFCNFENLEEADLSWNKLTLDNDQFKCGKKLKVLNLDFNDVSRVRTFFSNMTGLQTLILSNNKVDSIEKGAFPASLTTLDLNGNLIEAVNVSVFDGLVNLKKLYLMNNLVTFFEPGCFGSLKALTFLEMGGGKPIGAVLSKTFVGLVQLPRLDLSRRGVSVIQKGGFSGLDHLKFLRLENNLIEKVETGGFAGLNEVEVMFLMNNSIVLRQNVFNGLKAARLVYMSHNPVNDVLEEGYFEGLKSAILLDLNYNGIRVVRTGAFKGASQLRSLYLSNNQIDEIEEEAFVGLGELQLLELESNSIEVISSDMFYELNELKQLGLSGNRISRLETGGFNGLKTLKDLDLTGMLIRRLDTRTFTGLDGLTDLILTGNRIELIQPAAFEGLTNLTTLKLDVNDIKVLVKDSFLGLNKVEYLNLTSTNLTAVKSYAFNGLASLKTLVLPDTLKALDADSFNGLTALQNLDLSDTGLTKLTAGCFRGLANLQTLQLTGNNLTQIEPLAFAGLAGLTNLSLTGQIGTLKNRTFDGLSNLTQLNVSRLGVDAIEPGAFRGLAKTKTLGLKGNRITRLQRSTFEGLTSLDNLEINGLQRLDGGAFVGLTSLLGLFLVSANLTQVPRDAFSGTRLRYINLVHSNLGVVETDAFSQLPGLQTILLHNATVRGLETSAFSGTANLMFVFNMADGYTPHQGYDFHATGLCYIKPGAFKPGARPVQNGYFHQNRLTKISKDNFSGLNLADTLTLNNNLIDQLEPDAFATLNNLQVLNLANNDLRAIAAGSFNGLANLKDLLLNDNKIAAISGDAFSPLTRLTRLTLTTNRLKLLPSFNSNPLQNLALSGNHLQHLPTLNLTNIITLDVSHNSLATFDPDAILLQAGKLQHLQLSSNSLTHLNSSLLRKSAPSLATIDINDNNFDCASLKTILNDLDQLNVEYPQLALPKSASVNGVSCKTNGNPSNFDRIFNETLKKLDAIKINKQTDFPEVKSLFKLAEYYKKLEESPPKVQDSSWKVYVFEVMLVVVCVVVGLVQSVRLVKFLMQHRYRRLNLQGPLQFELSNGREAS